MIDPASVLPTVKTFYSPSKVQLMTQKKHPLYAMMRKREDLTGATAGRPFVNLLITGDGASGSHDFVTAQANSGAPASSNFQLTASKDYATPTVDNMTIEATANDKGAFFSALKFSVDGALREAAMSAALSLIGDGTGGRGTASAVSTTANTATLTDINQCTNFQAAVGGKGGTQCQFAFVSAGTWSLRAGTAQVTGIDRNKGILTFSGGLPTNAAAGDIIVRAGDLPSGTPWNNGSGTTAGSSSGGQFAGLGGFLPLIKPQPGMGDSFGGMDRSADWWRFAGGFYDGRNKNKTEAINGALAVTRREGGEPDLFVVNESVWNDIQNDQEGKVEIETVQAFNAPQIGFRTIVINSPGGRVRILADNTVPSDRGYLLQLDTWTLWSMNGPLVRILGYPQYGAAYIPSSTADAVQIRIGGYGLLECAAPGFNCVVQFK